MKVKHEELSIRNKEIYTAPLILYISLASVSLIILYLILNY